MYVGALARFNFFTILVSSETSMRAELLGSFSTRVAPIPAVALN